MQPTKMLDESEKLLAQMKHGALERERKRQRRKHILQQTKKWAIRGAVIIIIGCALFFPVQTGEVIGQWLHDFFGTIVRTAQ